MANRWWVGGTGTWDASTTTHWSSVNSGGAGGASVPGSADPVIFDANSGGGTVTVNTTVNVSSITCGAHTGTLDFSANNNNVTVGSFVSTATGTRTLNLGNGTWTITGTASNVWAITATNLTFNANSSVLTFTATTTATRNFTPGTALTYSTVTVSPNTLGGPFLFNGAGTFGTLNVSGPEFIQFAAFSTFTISTINISGSSGSVVSLLSGTPGTTTTLSVASNAPTITWAAIRDLTCTGGATFAATNSFDLGHNSGITITAPMVVRHPPTYQIGI